MPVLIAFTFVGTTATAIVLNGASLSRGLKTYLLGLLVVDGGMVAVEVMAWLIGRKLWREDRDFRYVGIVVGFASLPVWGSVEALCVSWMIPVLSESNVCAVSGGLSWAAFVWLVTIPNLAVLLDFRRFLARGAERPG
ncbi:MAG TPA: hypothetical protein VF992_07855 [Thermoplasmata archaeon]